MPSAPRCLAAAATPSNMRRSPSKLRTARRSEAACCSASCAAVGAPRCSCATSPSRLRVQVRGRVRVKVRSRVRVRARVRARARVRITFRVTFTVRITVTVKLRGSLRVMVRVYR